MVLRGWRVYVEVPILYEWVPASQLGSCSREMIVGYEQLGARTHYVRGTGEGNRARMGPWECGWL